VSESSATGQQPKQGAKPFQFRVIRGLRDLLPAETALWNHVEETAHAIFGTFGFSEIRLPIFEPARLFERTVGTDTDIAQKELYFWVDSPKANNAIRSIRGVAQLSKDVASNPNSEVHQRLLVEAQKGSFDTLADTNRVALRPEATASVCRAYIEHNMQQLPQPVKLYYMGPMFRRERPQKGRYRQFYQIGAEVLGGNDAPGIDAEVIEMLMTFFDKLELKGLELDINSIGCRECRPKYVEVLRAALIKVKDKLGADSQRRIDTNPLRVLDSKLGSEQEIIATLPRMATHLCADCAEHFAEVKRQLELRGVIYRENWRLVRGLDYYMRTTFEITAQGLGSQNAVCGGGRYDGLVELLGGPPTKGIGFAIGEDRLILSLQESGKAPPPPGRDIYIAWMGEKAFATAIRAAKELRVAGYRVELPATEQKFGKALGQADKLGARYALILGEDEVTSGEWTLKTLADGSQKKYTESDLLEYLQETKQAAKQQL
jgi:histidyl-tRNA synthetase